jgi:hypothetical protein
MKKPPRSPRPARASGRAEPPLAAPGPAPASAPATENQAALATALARVRSSLQALAAAATSHPASPLSTTPSGHVPDPASALGRLCTGFKLSPFERDLLLLCAGPELDAAFPSLISSALGDPARRFPTFGLALAALPGAHWSSLSPDAPLRRWRLLEPAPTHPAEPLATTPLRIDERVLHFLCGVSASEPRLRGLLDTVPIPEELSSSHLERARQLALLWRQASATDGAYPAVQLLSADTPAAAGLAALASDALGLGLRLLRATDLPAAIAERADLARLLDREAVLGRFALLVELEPGAAADTAHAVTSLLDRLQTPSLVCAPEPLRLRVRPFARIEVSAPTPQEQQSLWRAALGPATAAALNGHVELVSTQFRLSPTHIRSAAEEFLRRAPAASAKPSAPDSEPLGSALWDACRAQARPRLDGLARRIEARATWDDLVLPTAQLETLRAIAAHVRRRAQVYGPWGFAAQSDRGLGISALFAGGSGTGKTLAAEVIARELRLDLYRVDLASLVSKYIGETEKNLRQIFDAAETGGAILLFDEADACFGKRSEVRDSHDRYANIEVGYLLQRLECYRGLALLTTNQPQSIDTAFARRIRFTVHFPFPDAATRARIWQRVFPPATPVEKLAHEKLARLNLSGGHIRNLALNAAFLAADAGQPVRMHHLLAAARSEYAKLEKNLSAAETAGWV